MAKYLCSADPRNENGEHTAIRFRLEASEYKSAWQDARDVCRRGREVEIENPDTGEYELGHVPAGIYTMRKVFSQDRARGAAKKAVITAKQLIDVADERNITVNKKLRELFMELAGEQQPAEPAAAEGDKEGAQADNKQAATA